jgi:hypothetical protein
MNITSLSSGWNVASGVDTVSGASSYVAAGDSGVAQARSSIQQQSQNFKALTGALQSGDLAGAQGAYATLQQQIQSASQSTGGTSLFNGSSSIGKDFKAIGSALQSGDVSGAQSALASFKQDIKAARHHRHSHGTAGNQASSPATSSSGTSTNSSSSGGALDAVA